VGEELTGLGVARALGRRGIDIFIVVARARLKPELGGTFGFRKV